MTKDVNEHVVNRPIRVPMDKQNPTFQIELPGFFVYGAIMDDKEDTHMITRMEDAGYTAVTKEDIKGLPCERLYKGPCSLGEVLTSPTKDGRTYLYMKLPLELKKADYADQVRENERKVGRQASEKSSNGVKLTEGKLTRS